MKKIFSYIKGFFTFCLYLGRGKKADPTKDVSPKKAAPKGTDGLIEDPAMFVRHNGKNVLVVTQDLGDVPGWVEYDETLKQFSIVQNGGSVAYLRLILQDEDREAARKDGRLLLVTEVEERKVLHHVQFIVR